MVFKSLFPKLLFALPSYENLILLQISPPPLLIFRLKCPYQKSGLYKNRRKIGNHEFYIPPSRIALLP